MNQSDPYDCKSAVPKSAANALLHLCFYESDKGFDISTNFWTNDQPDFNKYIVDDLDARRFWAGPVLSNWTCTYQYTWCLFLNNTIVTLPFYKVIFRLNLLYTVI